MGSTDLNLFRPYFNGGEKLKFNNIKKVWSELGVFASVALCLWEEREGRTNGWF